jgi:hypothetical protein
MERRRKYRFANSHVYVLDVIATNHRFYNVYAVGYPGEYGWTR